MLCPTCNRDNSSDAAFCEHCGSKLERSCPNCKAPVSSGARFCKKCGVPVESHELLSEFPTVPHIRITTEGAASQTSEGERKMVTALFADLKGSTELMEDLDPEEAHAIVDPALRIMVEAVQRYG